MKKKAKRLIGLLLTLCLIIVMFPSITVQAKTKYKLNYTSKVMYEKSTFNLYPEMCFEKVTYSSSNSKIASVTKKGIVKAKKVGKATITVKVGKQKMKCKVTVKKLPTEKDIEVKQYCIEEFGDTERILIIKNNSKETISVDTNTKALNENGNVIGADSGSCLAIGSKQTSVLVENFSNTTNIADFDTKYTVKISSYNDALKNLLVDKEIFQNKIIFTATNKNNYDVMFVTAHILMFKDGQFIGYQNEYIDDNSIYGIKSNQTYTTQVDIYYDYDYIEVYYTGRG